MLTILCSNSSYRAVNVFSPDGCRKGGCQSNRAQPSPAAHGIRVQQCDIPMLTTQKSLSDGNNFVGGAEVSRALKESTICMLINPSAYKASVVQNQGLQLPRPPFVLIAINSDRFPVYLGLALKRELVLAHGAGNKNKQKHYHTARQSIDPAAVLSPEETLLCKEILAIQVVDDLLDFVRVQGHCFTCFAAATAIAKAYCLLSGRQLDHHHLGLLHDGGGKESAGGGVLASIMASQQHKYPTVPYAQGLAAAAAAHDSAAVEVLQRAWAPLAAWLPCSPEQVFSDVLPALGDLSRTSGAVGLQAREMATIIIKLLSARSQHGNRGGADFVDYLREAEGLRTRLAEEGRDVYAQVQQEHSYWTVNLPPADLPLQPLQVNQARSAASLLYALAVLWQPAQQHPRLVQWLATRLDACMQQLGAPVSAKDLSRAAYALAMLGNPRPSTCQLVLTEIMRRCLETHSAQQQQQQQQTLVAAPSPAADSCCLDAAAMLDVCRAIALLSAQGSLQLTTAVHEHVSSRLHQAAVKLQVRQQHQRELQLGQGERGEAKQSGHQIGKAGTTGSVQVSGPLSEVPVLLEGVAELAAGATPDGLARQLLRNSSALAAELIPELSTEGVIQILSAYALAREAAPQVMQAVKAYVNATPLSKLSGGLLAQGLWAYAQLGKADHQLFQPAMPVLLGSVGSMNSEHQLQALSAYAWYWARSASKDKTRSRVLINIDLVQALVQALQPSISNMNPGEVAMFAWALVQLTWYDEDALQVLHHRVAAILKHLRLQQLGPVLHLLALTHSCPAPADLVTELTRTVPHLMHLIPSGNRVHRLAVVHRQAGEQASQLSAPQVKMAEAHIVRIIWGSSLLGVTQLGAVQQLFHALATHVGGRLAPVHCMPLAQAILSFAPTLSSSSEAAAAPAAVGDGAGKLHNSAMQRLPGWMQPEPVSGLVARCLQRYLILTQSTSPSLTQLSVLETLTYHVSGVTSVRSEVAISGGLFTVDALVTYHAVEVVVEVDGPSHFFLNRPGIVTGETLWRRGRLKELGYLVAPVRATEFMAQHTIEAKARLLAEILRLAVEDPAALEGRERGVGDAIGPLDHLPLSGQAVAAGFRDSSGRARTRSSQTFHKKGRHGKGGGQEPAPSQPPDTPSPSARPSRGRRRVDMRQAKELHVRAGKPDAQKGQHD